MLAVGGYTGFRRRNEDQDLIKADPGVTEASRHKKFTVAATAVLSKPKTLASTYGTVTATAAATVKPADFVIPKRGGPVQKPIPPARFVGQSVYSSQYPDYVKDAFKLKSHSAEEYEAAFAEVDTDGSGFISVDEIAALLTRVFGHAPSDFQVNGFLAYFDSNQDGVISLEEFKAGLDTVADNLADSVRAAAKASSVPVSRIPPAVRTISAAPLVTSYGADGAPPSLATATFSGSTQDLCAGTSKLTAHVPGYSGYIPESGATRSELAGKQGSGAAKRDTFHAKTNLGITFARSLPGYTGHVPSNTSSAVLVGRPTGIHAHTEQDAAAALITHYWEARK